MVRSAALRTIKNRRYRGEEQRLHCVKMLTKGSLTLDTRFDLAIKAFEHRRLRRHDR